MEWYDLDDDRFADWLAGADQGLTLDEQLGRCRPRWFDRARCRGLEPELFYPAPGESADAARAVCADCPVSGPCGSLALENSERFGVWAGLGPGERRALRRAG